ncbi:MAG: UDP-N-acetylmuramoyl-tripeptide--D-alanyl-D-alanine ligase, partial [Clostridia bacterium]|nr:UDP-N-acetylmuramoyl-tripeptide--D-alanyl-D-alanine ligase [Clostridia bacterium]
MMELNLQQIAEAVGGTLKGDGTVTVSGVSTDSRTTKEGELFIALRGEKFDGHDFIPSLVGKCAAVISEKEFPGINVILVKDTLKALGRLAAFWKSHVAPRYTVGVTGSVGKTTTKELIAG